MDNIYISYIFDKIIKEVDYIKLRHAVYYLK